jgi:hypothetical protein
MHLQHTKIMGAQKARTLVKNHCRHATMSSVFFVSIHVWLSIAIVDVGARKGLFRGVERRSEYCFVTVSSKSCNEIIDYESRAATMLYPGVIKRVAITNQRLYRQHSGGKVVKTIAQQCRFERISTTAKRQHLVVFICLARQAELGMVLEADRYSPAVVSQTAHQRSNQSARLPDIRSRDRGGCGRCQKRAYRNSFDESPRPIPGASLIDLT